MHRKLRSLLAIVLSLGILSAALAWQGIGVKSEPPIEKISAVQIGPRYWKGNLHTHSLWSDGDDFPEMIADWYHRHGYHFLPLSDHNVLSERERWIDMRAGARSVALDKYLKRFGPGWVERRKANEKGEAKDQVRLKPLSE